MIAPPNAPCRPCVHFRPNHCRAKQRGWPRRRCGYFVPNPEKYQQRSARAGAKVTNPLPKGRGFYGQRTAAATLAGATPGLAEPIDPANLARLTAALRALWAK